MQSGIYILLALFIGIISAIYMPMNSSVSKYLGSPLTANITFYFVALVTSVIVFIVVGDFETISNIKIVPVYLFLTGVISAFVVLSITFLIPVIGVRKLLVISLAGQLVMAMIVSHLGILESPKDPITIKKIIGATLLFVGAVVSVS